MTDTGPEAAGSPDTGPPAAGPAGTGPCAAGSPATGPPAAAAGSEADPADARADPADARADPAGAGRADPAPSHPTGLPRPARRQVLVTSVLVGIVVVVGIVLLVTKASPRQTRNPAAGPSTPAATVPASNPQASADDAALEVRLRQTIGGCWDEAEPGAADGAYRQDFHYPADRPCGLGGWDVDVQLFATTTDATAAARRVAAGRTAFVSPYSLILVDRSATPAVLAAVAAQPGVHAAA